MPSLNMPCLKPEGLSVFTQTPEQRLLLGAEWFAITHIPMQLRKFVHGEPRSISEEELFAQFQNTNRYVGNRVIALYGAAGSGKSELMTWMEQEFSRIDPHRPVIRISRTELDVLSVINRMRHLLTGDYFSETTIQRWEEMRRKPRTLSKILVLHALERLLDSDDLINALFYRLIDIVEPQIELILERTAGHEVLDIVLRDDFNVLKMELTLPLPFDFEAFRQNLLDGFREMMLENISIRETLTALSSHFTQKKQRPVILIDDLVQSINLFATEFLDSFTTLDQGNWDVMIGITPASFQYDARGRELLDRLNQLDTIDDRVDKFWLSDEQGLESFFLNEGNCASIAFSYLQAFRRFNQMLCSQCPVLNRCQSLQNDESYLTSPFNEAALVRLFRSLPSGKGKVRAFITALRQVLEIIIDGNRPEIALATLANTELFVESDVAPSSELIKWYARGETGSDIAHILDFFGAVHPSHLYITTLNSTSALTEDAPSDPMLESQDDHTRLAVRDWLEGKEANRQLLQKLRKGISIWLRGIQLPIALTSFHHPHIARPNRVLRDMLMEMDTTPPIALEDVDDFLGIEITRTIGHLAFLFVSVGDTGGRVQSSIDRKLAQDPRSLHLIWKAQQHMAQRQRRLENQIGSSLETFALAAYVLRLLLNGVPQLIPAGIPSTQSEALQAIHEHLRYFIAPLPAQMVTLIDKLFDDFFKLRDNVYDSSRITYLLRENTIDSILRHLSLIQSASVDDVFWLGNIPLRDFIGRLNGRSMKILGALHNDSPTDILMLSPQGREVLGRLQQGDGVPLNEIPVASWHDFHEKTPDFYQRMQVFLTRQSD